MTYDTIIFSQFMLSSGACPKSIASMSEFGFKVPEDLITEALVQDCSEPLKDDQPTKVDHWYLEPGEQLTLGRSDLGSNHVVVEHVVGSPHPTNTAVLGMVHFGLARYFDHCLVGF